MIRSYKTMNPGLLCKHSNAEWFIPTSAMIVSFSRNFLSSLCLLNTCQVKDPFMHSEGADVIQHMMDHFLLA
ncbi:hypothetical protein BHE74_00034860 [Ensete ventricosum]|nr:hypothetical protein BHE74_00034860 [Ensete ventricosum]